MGRVLAELGAAGLDRGDEEVGKGPGLEPELEEVAGGDGLFDEWGLGELVGGELGVVGRRV